MNIDSITKYSNNDLDLKIIKNISNILKNIINNDNNKSNIITIYNSISIPKITVYNFLIKIYKYLDCGIECYIVALIYIDKFLKKYPNIILNNYNIHRILLIFIIIAIKYLEDIPISNKYYAKLCGLSLKEINKLEKQTLQNLNYDLFISKEDFDTYYSFIIKI